MARASDNTRQLAILRVPNSSLVARRDARQLHAEQCKAESNRLETQVQ